MSWQFDGPLTKGRLRPSGVWRLYWIRLRRRWPQELLALIGIAVGVALLFASQVASTSLSGPVRQLSRGIVGNSQLQLVARGPEGLSETIAEQVRRLPGVRLSAPIVQVQANLVGSGGARNITVFGADPSVVKLRGSLLQGFSSSDAARQRVLIVPEPVAATTGLRFGDTARLQVAGRSFKVPVAVASARQIGVLTNTSIGLAPLSYIQDLSGLRGRYSRILIEAIPGQLAAVRAGLERLAAGRLDVVAADHERRLFDAAAAPTSQATTIFSVLSALVGFLFAVCAMLVTASGRRTLAIDLRRSGLRRFQIVRILLVDALLLGVVSVVAGLALGELLSREGFGSDVSFLSGAFPVGDERVVTWSSVTIAAGGGFAAAALGVLAPLREFVFPRRSAGPLVVDRRRSRWLVSILGLVCLVIAVVLTASVPGAAVVSLIVLGLSLALLLPSLMDAGLVVVAWVSRRGRGGWMPAVELALQQLRSSEWRVRSLAIAMTGAIAVFGSISLQGSRSNLQDGIFRVAPGLNQSADVWITPRGPGELFGTTPVPDQASRVLARIPEVEQVALYRAGFLDVADRRALVFGPPSSGSTLVPTSQVLSGDPAVANSRLRAGGWATISKALAEALRVSVGDRVRLPMPVPMELRVAAITTNLGWSGGTIFVNADDYARGWASAAVGAYQVRLRPGTAPAEGRRLVAAALGRQSPLMVETAAQRSDRQQAVIKTGLARLSQIASLTLLAAVLAMSAAIAGLLWQHRRVISRQKLDGHKTKRMWRALFVEAGALIIIGCLAGAVFALLGQVLCTRGVEAVTGFPVVHGIRPGIVASSFALVVGTSLAVVAVPGYLVARTRPSLHD